MTCSEFETRFNELIDGERQSAALVTTGIAAATPPDMAGLERALLDHAGRCPACREVAARYQILRRALHAWNSPPVAPDGLAERILAAEADAGFGTSSVRATGDRRKRKRVWRTVLAYASVISAAAACALVLPAINSFIERQRQSRPMPRATSSGPGKLDVVAGSPPARLADSRVLNDALAEATWATWDLARSASEPAARISRQMLAAATGSEIRPGAAAISGRAVDLGAALPVLNSLAPDSSDAGAMLQEVGDRLASSVAPLSRTARHAFGFLLGTSNTRREGRGTPPAVKGA